LEEEILAGDTPLMDEYEEEAFHAMTDYIQRTPEYGRGGYTSEYCRTPGGGG
jgi:hypothetical protein